MLNIKIFKENNVISNIKYYSIHFIYIEYKQKKYRCIRIKD